MEQLFALLLQNQINKPLYPDYREKKQNKIYTEKITKKQRYNNPELLKTTFIIAPHPDDEILCCSEKISEKISNGELVKIVYITNGDAIKTESINKSIAYGKTRERESKKAAEKLKIAKRNLYFFNFPDGFIRKLPKNGSLTSSYTGQDRSDNFSYLPKTPYNKTILKENLEKLITLYRPTEVYYPNPDKEVHTDHEEVGVITEEILSKNTQIIGKSYTIHHKRGKLSKKYLEYLSLSKKTEPEKIDQNKKLNLIRTFKSQFHDNYHTKFLENFAFIPEQFETFIPPSVVAKLSELSTE